jgi:hypothetical protein
LCITQLIFTGLEINDQVNLQWSSILATTEFESEITRRTNILILNFYH